MNNPKKKPDDSQSGPDYWSGLDWLKQGNPKQACESFRKAVQANPLNDHAWCMLSKTQLAEGHLDDASMSALKAYIAKPESLPNLLQYADTLINLKSFDQAETILRQAMEAKPETPETHATLGRIFLLQGKTQWALDACKSAMAIDPWCQRAYAVQNTAMAQTHQGICYLTCPDDMANPNLVYSIYSLCHLLNSVGQRSIVFHQKKPYQTKSMGAPPPIHWLDDFPILQKKDTLLLPGVLASKIPSIRHLTCKIILYMTSPDELTENDVQHLRNEKEYYHKVICTDEDHLETIKWITGHQPCRLPEPTSPPTAPIDAFAKKPTALYHSQRTPLAKLMQSTPELSVISLTYPWQDLRAMEWADKIKAFEDSDFLIEFSSSDASLLDCKLALQRGCIPILISPNQSYPNQTWANYCIRLPDQDALTAIKSIADVFNKRRYHDKPVRQMQQEARNSMASRERRDSIIREWCDIFDIPLSSSQPTQEPPKINFHLSNFRCNIPLESPEDIQKAVMWQRVADHLSENKLTEPSVLDINTSSFMPAWLLPPGTVYYGLSHSFHGLSPNLKTATERQFGILADLINPLPEEMSFDILIGLNFGKNECPETFASMIANAIQRVKAGGIILLEIADQQEKLPVIMRTLLKHTEECHIEYVRPWASEAINPQNGNFTAEEMIQSTNELELSLPNLPELHRNALIIAKRAKNTSGIEPSQDTHYRKIGKILVPSNHAVPKVILAGDENEEIDIIIKNIEKNTSLNDCLIIVPNKGTYNRIEQALQSGKINYNNEQSSNGVAMCRPPCDFTKRHKVVIMPCWDGNHWFPDMSEYERSCKLRKLRSLAMNQLIIIASEKRYGSNSELSKHIAEL